MCPPVLKNIQLLSKEFSITVTSVSISASDKERRLHVSISTVSQSTIHTHTHTKAQPLTARARRCGGNRLRECPITIAYPRHHPSSFPFINCVLAGLVQGLIGVPLPTPHQLLDCQNTPTLPFIQLRVLGIGCVLIFFPLD